MKDNLLEEGDALLVYNGHHSTPLVRRIDRVAKAYAYAGEYRVHRKVTAGGWVREVAPQKWSLRSFSLPTPDKLAEAQEASDIADACRTAYELGEQLKRKTGEARRFDKAQLPALLEVNKLLSSFFAPPLPIEKETKP